MTTSYALSLGQLPQGDMNIVTDRHEIVIIWMVIHCMMTAVGLGCDLPRIRSYHYMITRYQIPPTCSPCGKREACAIDLICLASNLAPREQSESDRT